MSQKSKSSKLLKARFENFKGMDSRICCESTQLFPDMENFRVLSDGSLKKREGYRTVFSQPNIIRAVWSGHIGDSFNCYLLISNQVRRLIISDGRVASCGNINTMTGDAEFFFLRDTLYLKDESAFYKIDDSGVSVVTGYIPLLGKDWDVGYPGEINESLNLLHRRARITYKVGDAPSAYLPTLYPVESIDALYKNGVLLSQGTYSFDERFNTINVSDLVSGDRLEAHLTFSEDDTQKKEQIISFCHCGVFGGIKANRLFLWGDNSPVIFNSRYVSPENIAASEAVLANSGALYFVSGDEFSVGDGKYPVRAIERHYDRLLIFTSGDAWMADESVNGTEEFPTLKINTNVGLVSRRGIALAGNDPITVSKYGIYRWTSDTDELNECNAYRISDPVSDMFDKNFYKRAIAFSNKKHGEIWFADPEGDGTVWIYDYLKNYWTRFSGITPKSFLDADGKVGFATLATVRCFDNEAMYDYENVEKSNSKPIYAKLRSAYLDLGDARVKKLTSLMCCADYDSGSMTLNITDDAGKISAIDLSSKKQYAHVVKRLKVPRLRGFNFELSTGAEGRQRICSIEIEAR